MPVARNPLDASDVRTAGTEPLLRLTTGPVSRVAPAVAKRVARAVARGGASGLLPPVVRLRRGPDGGPLAIPDGDLSGPGDARALLAVLSTPAFEPLLRLLDALRQWSAAQAGQFADAIAPHQLDPLHGAVYGSLVREAFIRCAGDHRIRDNDDYLRVRLHAFCAAMERFLMRLQRDLGDGRLAALGARGRVIALSAHGDETHNGFDRVLRLRFRSGAALAYKARPSDGERLLLGDGGLFDTLRGLPAAAGAFRLPTLPMADGADGDCLWCEWIAPARPRGVLRRTPDWALRGPRLSLPAARRFWQDAGALTATCFRFGVADLYAGNLLVGERGDLAEPMPYPVDPEVCFSPMPSLHHTGLIGDAADSGNHHVGFERLPRACSADIPLAAFVRGPDGLPELRRIASPMARADTDNVVGDVRGGIGYAAHITAFLRGMFDAWATLCVERPAIEHWLRRHARNARTRVLRRSSEVYAAAMDADTLGASAADAGPDGGFDAAERAQMRRGDLPAFYRRLRGGPLLWVAVDRAGATRPRSLRCDDPPPLPSAGTSGPADFVDLAVALRDAVAYVHRELQPGEHEDRALGVRLRVVSARRGEAAFDWAQQGHRLIFRWSGDRIRLRTERLPPTAEDWAQARERLLRVDRIDAALRGRWVAAGFPSRGPIARELRDLERAAADWLRELVDDLGWPSPRRVGARAAEAACRLVQHLDAEPEFQRHCLRLLRKAVAAGDAPARQSACLEDALCVASGRPQRYGTKLRRVDGALVPCPIRAAGQVDARRAEVGLPPMAKYLARARRKVARMERAAT